MPEKSSKFSNLLVLTFMEQSTLKKFIREIQFAGFAAMHMRAATCLGYSVELEKLAVEFVEF